DPEKISGAKFIIIAVPTPVDKSTVPDLSLVESATAMVGKYLTPGSVVVYESTVYPGVTEDLCVPILESESKMKCPADFKVGYSPERVNPGDREHSIDKVVKVVSGIDAESLELIASVYGAITAVYRAPSIKVAEAEKAMENAQRDLNIALMNELAVIFNKIGISVYDVIDAASTKWNFLRFYPGLVGGHCIGVDPYYLTHQAKLMGYYPEVMLSVRHTNDAMAGYLAGEAMKCLLAHRPDTTKAKVVIAGLTFKENIPDIRNSKVFDIYNELKSFGIAPFVYDPLADKAEAKAEYGIDLCSPAELKDIDLLIFAVPHQELKKIAIPDIMSGAGAVVFDIKRALDKNQFTRHGITYWTL
ncbi:MAG: nucleotide sugar dehydrogenase, partial [Patescibacteria group bacterium]